jgi:O-antigen/teichoic acid export membrane protein
MGSLLAGLLAYVFFIASTRTLGASAAAPVTVLWTYWSLAAAALTFPLQHWIAHSVAADGAEAAVRRALPKVAAGVALGAVVAAAAAWVAREALFHRDDPWFPLLVAAVTVGAALTGVVRGGLSARHRFLAVAAALVAENALRCLGVLALALAGARQAVAYGICLAAGALTGLAWPTAVRFSGERGGDRTSSVLRFLGGAAGGQLIAQSVLTVAPVLLALLGGSAAQVTAVFAGLALFRAPYTVALGLVSQLTGRITAMVAAGGRGALARVRLAVWAATAICTAAAAGAAAAAGPELIRFVFGSGVELGRWPCGLLAAGSALALGNLVLGVLVLSQARTSVTVRAWLIGCAAGAGVLVAASTDPLERTCWAFLVAEAVAFVSLAVGEAKRG